MTFLTRQSFTVSSFILALYLSFCISCTAKTDENHGITINDPNLAMELVAQEPDIVTPIGMVIDNEDAIYILESNTHGAEENYQGHKFDRIKKSIDKDRDGNPEGWTVFADSIKYGINLAYSDKHGIFLTTKNNVYHYLDTNADGISDSKMTLVEIVEPVNVYDHGGILGIAMGPDDWVYISRGHIDQHWVIKGADGSKIEGYGDGGSVFRCKLDGSHVEEIATGFWNPFDLKFNKQGRLFATDNDPDSRGPNRLIEIVLGGDYGYKSLYGGSGINPYLSWNGELPGTLPYAAPLGEAPCSMMDAAYTNFGADYEFQMLVNVWEEKNIVRIPLKPDGSTVKGKPETLVQGDSLFHPVALATNSKGDLYIADWVMREYPVHGKGKIWRISSKMDRSIPNTERLAINRFKTDERSVTQLISDLTEEDVFEKSTTRYYLARRAKVHELASLVSNENPELRLQALLTFFDRKEILKAALIKKLLSDENTDVRKMALIYIGRKGLINMQSELVAALRENQIASELFETFLVTIMHLQPAFIEGIRTKSGRSSKVPRELPKDFIKNILNDAAISENVKTIALPYLHDYNSNSDLVLELLKKASEESFQIALLQAAKLTGSIDVHDVLEDMVFNINHSDQTRAMALMELSYFPKNYFSEVFLLLKSEKGLLQYAALKHLCSSPKETPLILEVQEWMETNSDTLSETALGIWNRYRYSEGTSWDSTDSNVSQAHGNPEIGRLVYQDRASLCTSCHKIEGWGGTFGPELSKIASSKSRSQLVDAILEPSKEISPEYQGWFLVDENGARHTGRQIDVNKDYIELMNLNEEFDKFKNSKSYGVEKSSLMPDNLEESMTKNEFNDLIAYLLSLK